MIWNLIAAISLLFLISCSPEYERSESESNVLEKAQVLSLPDRISRIQETLNDCRKIDTQSAAEAEHYRSQIPTLQRQKDLLEGMFNSNLFHRDGEVRSSIPISEMSERQLQDYHAAEKALQAFLDLNVTFKDGMKIYVENAGSQTEITIENEVRSGAFGADFSGKAIIDNESGEVINFIR